MNATTRKPRETKAQRSARLDALAEQLRTLAASTSEADQAAYAARFDDRYSARNAMLIVMQMPTATVVRGYDQWKAEGRQVRSGETSLKIRKVIGGGEGEDAPAGGKKAWKSCIWLSVFDISQTDPIPVETAADEDEQPAGTISAAGHDGRMVVLAEYRHVVAA